MVGGMKFATASTKINTIGLSDIASYTEAGGQEYPVVFPFKLRFKSVYELPRETIGIDYKEQLKTIPADSTLYEVYALDAPEELGGTEMHIATVVTDSEVTTSRWGDEHLEFRHQRYEDDLAYMPEWTPYIPTHDMSGWNGAMVCPFGFLKRLLF